MRVHYGPPSAAYACVTRHQRYGEPLCQSLTIAHVDRAVGEAFLAVIQPAQVAAALALAKDVERDRAAAQRQWALRLERARYEAERAFRQYGLCEPENRLVARELEARWNAQLRAVAALEAQYQQEQDRSLAPLTPEEQAALWQLVGDVRISAFITTYNAHQAPPCTWKKGIRFYQRLKDKLAARHRDKHADAALPCAA
jgi:hypothetical protein